jgi:hypothetical protein
VAFFIPVSFSRFAAINSDEIVVEHEKTDRRGKGCLVGELHVSISSLANGALGEQRRAFRGGLYATKAVASTATPPKKYLRADYCCKNQEPGCYGHLFILVFRRELGRCLLRPAAETRLSPTKRSRKSSVARIASAWPALLVQRGNLNGIDRQRLGTTRPAAVAPLKRPASLSVDPISGIPTSNMRGERLALCLVPDVR